MNYPKFQYLIVENATDVCEGIIRRMKPYRQWESIGYCIGVTQAIQTIETARPHLIFLDWSLNGGSAYQVLDHIQAMHEYHPFIIFNTGFQRDNPEIPQEIMNKYRIDKYLIKPYWENLRLNLSTYLQEAALRFATYSDSNHLVWITDGDGNRIPIDPRQITCIFQHPGEARKRLLYFAQLETPVIVDLSWKNCSELLTKNGIDYFITKARHSLIIRSYVQSYKRPIIKITDYPLGIEVVKENCKRFEVWLGEGKIVQ